MIKVNSYGKMKAEKFRRRFNMTTEGFADKDYIDVHDYLHTVAGSLPVYGPDEDKVFELEEKIKNGLKLRGLSYA